MRCIASKDKGISQRLFKRINGYYALKHERVTKWSSLKMLKIKIHNDREYERSGGGGVNPLSTKRCLSFQIENFETSITLLLLLSLLPKLEVKYLRHL